MVLPAVSRYAFSAGFNNNVEFVHISDKRNIRARQDCEDVRIRRGTARLRLEEGQRTGECNGDFQNSRLELFTHCSFFICLLSIHHC